MLVKLTPEIIQNNFHHSAVFCSYFSIEPTFDKIISPELTSSGVVPYKREALEQVSQTRGPRHYHKLERMQCFSSTGKRCVEIN